MRIRLLLAPFCAAALVHAQTAPVTAVNPAQVVVFPGQASSAVATAAVPTAVETVPVVPAGETAVTLDVAFGIRAVMPSRVTVPVGERLQMTAPAVGTQVQWQKDGKSISGATSTTLVLNGVTSADAGTYVAVYDAANPGKSSQALLLAVGPTARVTNVSNRGWVGPADQPFVTGFVVTTTGGFASKKILIRVIGPSLAPFGATNFLRQPTLTVFDSNGKPYDNGYVYPAVVGGPTYETDLANALARTGAFPTQPGARDVVALRPFVAGAYTIHVGSADGGAGAVLVEVYEVP